MKLFPFGGCLIQFLMTKNFIKGNFLPAYGRSFGRLKSTRPEGQSIDTATLDSRFRQRAIRYRTRRAEYLQGVQLGMAAALVLLIGAFNLNISVSGDADFNLSEQEVVQMEEILQTTQIEQPPPPPKPLVPVEVPNDEILEDVELELDMSLDLDAALSELPPPPPAPEKEEEIVEPEVFMVVEDMPRIVGGVAALLSDTNYPELARKAGLEGVVVVQIIIDEDGKASSPTVVKSVHEVLDKEAVRAVMEQSYEAGRQRGRAVKVAMNIPVIFRLN